MYKQKGDALNNNPTTPNREGLDLKNAMPPIPHEVLRTTSNIESTQITEQPVQTASQPEVVGQKPVQPQVAEESGNHDTSPSAPGLVFAQAVKSNEEAVDDIGKIENMQNAESVTNLLNQIQNDEQMVN